MLTIWLLLPTTIVSLLMVWIFVSLDKDRLMDDAVPIGAGAGDTGNANAIGEWLFGNNPDQISTANRARREHLMIDPRDWPGGVILRVPIGAFGQLAPQQPSVSVIDDETGEAATVAMSDSDEGLFVATISNDGLKHGARLVLSDGVPRREGDRFVDARGRGLVELSLSPQIPKADHLVDDPLVVTVRLDSVYINTAP